MQKRCFSYEKSIVINALYDTIDALGLRLDSSNSIRGTLIVSDVQHAGKMRIGLSFNDKTGRTEVGVFPEDKMLGAFNTWNNIILDELAGTIQRACCAHSKKN